MTLKELEFFYYLCENPHISQLSKKISISQSAISLAVKSLENKLEEPLFDRIGKKLILNERGRVFKKQTYKHFLALQDAKNIFKQDKLSGILKIASSKTIGNFIMPEIIFEFLLQNSQIKIQKDIKNSSQIIQLLLDAQIDIGIIETQLHDPNIIKEELLCDTLIVVTSDKKLAQKTYYVDQLFSKRWLLREKGSGTRELFINSLGEMAKDLNIFMEFTEFEEMKTVLSKHKETITCISKFAVAKELDAKELFEVKLKNIDLRRKLYIIYHKDKYKSLLFNSFKVFIKDHLNEVST